MYNYVYNYSQMMYKIKIHHGSFNGYKWRELHQSLLTVHMNSVRLVVRQECAHNGRH